MRVRTPPGQAPAGSTPQPVSLQASGITKIYGETIALWHVDVAAAGGCVVALTGPNGSGKSTLLRVLAGLTAPTMGTVQWLREVGAGRPRIGYLGHATHLYDALTPLEHLELAARLGRGDLGKAPEWLEQLAIQHVAAVPVGSLSAGTRRRVALARLLALDPDVLALDEPFASLDSDASASVSAVIRAAAGERRLVVVAGHSDVRLAALASKQIELRGGQITGRAQDSSVRAQ